MRKINVFLSIALLGMVIVAGCGKNNPSAPQLTSEEETVSTALDFTPTSSIYHAQLFGTFNMKPWYWFDAVDYPDFNAAILVNTSTDASNVTRINGGTWGKVKTFLIDITNISIDDSVIRIFIPSHSASVAWKLVIQEEGGAWRNWVLQTSTGYTGYKDYDANTILSQVKAGSGKFSIEVIVEGAVGEYIELKELNVFNKSDSYRGRYWSENFGVINTGGVPTHTPGWFDETTNPGFNATIINTGTGYDCATGRIEGDPIEGGKVLSPIIFWDDANCKFLVVWNAEDAQDYHYTVCVQEQSGQYRQWDLTEVGFDSGWGRQFSLSNVTGLSQGDPFSIAINTNETIELTNMVLGD